MDTSLLNQAKFAEADFGTWRKLAQKAIGDADFGATLVSSTDDGLRIDPLSQRRSDAAFTARGNIERAWDVVQRIDDPDPVRANAQARADLEGGATGIALVFEGGPNAFGYGLPATQEAVTTVLDGLPLSDRLVRIDAHPKSRQSIDWLFRTLATRRVNTAKLRIGLGIDPAAIFGGTGRLHMSLAALRASMPQSLAHFFALGLPGVLLEADGRVYHNAGATEAQELAAMLSTAVLHLRMFEEARQPLLYAAEHIGFAISIDQDQFLGMAKIRALRRLWQRVQAECGIDPVSAIVHAETSYRMMSFLDPETNILRTTIANFAAVAGGADSVSILPYTIAHGLPDAFARRVARNTQLVLAGESNIGYVADPGVGSGSVEQLTDELSDAAWREFQAIEAEGGILDSLAAGKLQARITAATAAREADYASGERLIVGTNLFPAKAERPVTTLAAGKRPVTKEGVVFCERLVPARIASPLEART